jgi:hypothetical protein
MGPLSFSVMNTLTLETGSLSLSGGVVLISVPHHTTP